MKRKVIVVGGGAAGLLAAGRAAESGAQVLVLEKMTEPGRKLRITGKGRCNITNQAPLDDFLREFGPGQRFLRPAFSWFFSQHLVGFLARLGVPTDVERGGRVFPKSDDAQDIVRALMRWTRSLEVETICGARVKRLLFENGVVRGIETASGERHHADAVILATGGASYPATGSTGDGYALARSAGHTVIPIRPALVPVITAGGTAARLQGLSLRNVHLNLVVDGRKADEAFGEMLFTHFGVSGPIVLTLSKQAGDALGARRQVVLAFDLKPALTPQQLDARLLRDIGHSPRQQFVNLLKALLPRTLIPVCADETQIPADRMAGQISAVERRRLRNWLKDFRLQVTGVRPMAEAIITAGVCTREVNPKTMESRLVAGLYFAGELLDVDAPTGGFNLQAAFSTGWLAGQAAATPVLQNE